MPTILIRLLLKSLKRNMKAKKELVRQLIESLNNEPEKWTFDKHKAVNKERDLSLWIGNGMSFLHVYKPYEVRFSLLGKMKLYKAINRCKAKKLLK